MIDKLTRKITLVDGLVDRKTVEGLEMVDLSQEDW
jgi:hypothetical protein